MTCHGPISAAVSALVRPARRRLLNFSIAFLVLTALISPVWSAGSLLFKVHAEPFSGTPYSGTPLNLPGRIEAENFDNGGEAVAYHDTTATNDGGFYRAEAVDVCSCGSPYGLSVGWTNAGEWLEYTVTIGSYGAYKFQTLTAAIGNGTAVHINVDGTNVTGQMNLPNSGAWGSYAATSSQPIMLAAGQHIVRLTIDVGGFLLDSIDVVRLNTPYGGTATTLPGTIPAENFDNGGESVAYHDMTATNDGGAYRSEGVDLCVCAFANGAALGWSQTGEWTRYTVNVSTTDTYTLQALIATISTGSIIHLELDGVNVTGQMVLPNTGAWGAWTTISKSNVPISAGQHDLKMVIESGGFLLDSLSALPSIPSAPSLLSANAVSTSQINLTWTDNSFNESGFKVERKTGPAGTYAEIAATAAGTTSFSNTGLQPNTQYFYRLRATNLGGNSAYSNEASAMTSNLLPSVSITSPVPGNVFTAPANITINASASDSDGTVSKVEFFQSSTKLGEDLTAPYSFSWTNIAAGTYNLTAKATDNLGGVSTSAVVNITVNALPVVSITAPAANAIFNSPANVTINASASDSDGTISKVEFYQGATKLGEDLSSPFTLDWTNVPQGSYSLSAVATDNRGASTTSATVSINVTSTVTARLDPMNRTGGGGEDPLSRNFNWALPVVHLPGRAGLNLDLSLSYNSLVWTKNGNVISFDDDSGFPSAGFRLGFPVIQPIQYNPEAGKYAYMLVGSDGSRTELRQVDSASLFEAVDSSHLLLDTSLTLPIPDNGKFVLRIADGTKLWYEQKGNDYQCTRVQDRNGNYITVSYTSFGRIDEVLDTSNRIIKFHYDNGNALTSITQDWKVNGSSVTHTWASFQYRTPNLTIQTNFSNELTKIGPANGTTLKVLSRVTLADNARFEFEYTSWGQVWRISQFANDGQTLLNYRSYDLPLDYNTTPAVDCPRFTQRRDWAKYWNRDTSGNEQEVVTSFLFDPNATWTMPGGSGSQTGMLAQVTLPDGTYDKTYSHASGWDKGLPLLTETYSNPQIVKRQVVTTWTQDEPGLTVLLNPRVTETKIYDPEGNQKRVQITYQQITGTNCRLPRDVFETTVQGNATIVLRSTRTTYKMDSAYTGRRIIGLVSERSVYDGDVTLGAPKVSSVIYDYDEPNSIQSNDSPVQHDTERFGADFVVGRGNLTSVKRYDVENGSSATTTSTKYNVAGAIVSSKDAANHEVTVSYTDAFAANGTTLDASRPFTTLAYPTTANDADAHASHFRYNYDTGAATWRQTPNVVPNRTGPEQTFTYDSVGRLERTTNLVNSAYERYIYGPNYVESWSTVNNLTDEAYSLQVFDGAARRIATAMNHPESQGGFSGQIIVYDEMARAVKQSNPTETSVTIPQSPATINPYTWLASGDDASGWLYTQQTYDWKGRPLRTTHPDNTYTEVEYSGCGCAGGEIATVTDEGTMENSVERRRRRKIYSDVLGRTVKTELLNWQDNTVYQATVNTYNARDQVESIREYAGAEGSPFQETTMIYDGFGRLKTRHMPEQSAGKATTWEYNADDTVYRITDARGASRTFTYNQRHQPTSITYAAAANSGIIVPGTVTSDYDAAGNRTSMSDGSGTTSYSYDQLSRLTSETRTFTGLSGSFSITYEYNLANQLISLAEPVQFGSTFSYVRDTAGRLSSVTGSPFEGVTSYVSNAKYRAWGDLKHLNFGNGKALDATYNNRLQVASFVIPGVMSKTYDYYADGTLRFSSEATSHAWDRFYSYDQAGRIKEAFSGAEARFEGLTNNRPYRQTFSYDVMGHLTGRTSKIWAESFSSSDSYSNNRRNGWSYDDDGNLLAGTNSYIYDARGDIQTIDPLNPTGTTTRVLDGDGRQAKTDNSVFNEQTSSWDTTTTYYLRSSMLQGQILTEINASGAKKRTFVYADGKIIGWQKFYGSTPAVIFEYRDASDASFRTTNSEGGLAGTEADELPAELDPTGANAFLLVPPEPPQGSNETMLPYPTFSDPRDLGMTYSIDGIRVPIDYFLQFANFAFHGRFGMAEAAARASSRVTGRTVTGVHWGKRFVAIYDGNGHLISLDEGDLDPSLRDTNYGNETLTYDNSWSFAFSVSPQNPTQKPMDTTQTEKMLTEDCLRFLNSILAQLKDPHNKNLLDILKAAKGRLFTRNLSDEEKKKGLGGTHSRVGDPAFYIYLGEAEYANDPYLLIHELFHGAAGTGTGYTHFDMATAAYKVALADPAFMKYANRHGGLREPKLPDYSPDSKDPEDWYNADVFDRIARQGCTHPDDWNW